MTAGFQDVIKADYVGLYIDIRMAEISVIRINKISKYFSSRDVVVCDILC